MVNLPHVSLILKRLLLVTRSPRPQLGMKQRTLVANTYPRWINCSEPLRAEEGRALGRLFVALSTKSTIRSYATSVRRGAESLAKPFSKHASYILQAYVEANNDPLYVMSQGMRKELLPGLFALCGMLNEHTRNAMMVSALDSGGKSAMKLLWKEYEKQTYTGQG